VVHHRYDVFLSGVRARVAKSQHLRTHVSLSALRPQTQTCLTNRWSQPLAGVTSTFNFMKQFPEFATLAVTSGGSALSR